MAAAVFVAMPLIGRDAGLVAGWAAALAAVAAAHPTFAFTLHAAARAGDEAAAAACRAASVEVVGLPWYAEPAPGCRKNSAGVLMARQRLARAALEAGAAVLWFVDADVRVTAAHWAAADGVFRAGRAVALIPYPARWAAGGEPAVCVFVPGDSTEVRLALVDARALRAAAPDVGGGGARVAGGSMGCTAILAPVAALVSFVVAEHLRATGTLGDDRGWFLNAARAGVEVRMPLGVAAEHLGV